MTDATDKRFSKADGASDASAESGPESAGGGESLRAKSASALADAHTGLAQRIMYAFALLIATVAVLYAGALMRSIEFAEENLIAGFLEDELQLAAEMLEQGEAPREAPTTRVYGDSPLLDPIPARLRSAPMGYTEFLEEPAAFVYRGRWQGGDLMIVRDQHDFESKERTFQRLVLLSVGLVFFLAAIFGWLLSRRIMKPVARLSDEVRAAAASPVYRPVKEEGLTDDEVGELAQICDSALRRLHQALDREKRFTGDVSHELRTPLTVIETSAELLEISELSPAQRERVAKIQRASADMRDLLTLFLQFARLAETETGASAPDGFDGILEQLLRVWRPQAEAKGLALEVRREAPCPGTYSPVMLGAVINNLIKNAIAYTSSGRVTVTERSWGFSVADTGPGIPESERQTIFEAFKRGSAAERPGAGEGAGLGLSIVSRICRRMGWQVTLESVPSGSRFDVRLIGSRPAARADGGAASPQS